MVRWKIDRQSWRLICRAHRNNEMIQTRFGRIQIEAKGHTKLMTEFAQLGRLELRANSERRQIPWRYDRSIELVVGGGAPQVLRPPTYLSSPAARSTRHVLSFLHKVTIFLQRRAKILHLRVQSSTILDVSTVGPPL
jgi:hypothetical protein